MNDNGMFWDGFQWVTKSKMDYENEQNLKLQEKSLITG